MSILMRYCDTSILVPLVLWESTSNQVEEFFAGSSEFELAISQWTRVEFFSSVSRYVRMGHLEVTTAQAAGSKFEAIVENSFAIISPNRDDFEKIKRICKALRNRS